MEISWKIPGFSRFVDGNVTWQLKEIASKPFSREIKNMLIFGCTQKKESRCEIQNGMRDKFVEKNRYKNIYQNLKDGFDREFVPFMYIF